VVVCDRESRVLYFNPAFHPGLRVDLGGAPRAPLERFVPEDNEAETKVMMERLMAGESFFGLESRRYSKGGQILPVSVSGTVYRDRDGNPVGSIINLRDITEQKKLQGQLQHAQKMEAVGTLAGGIATISTTSSRRSRVRGAPFQGKTHGSSRLRWSSEDPERGQTRSRTDSAVAHLQPQGGSRKRSLDLNYEVHEVQRLLERTLRG